MEVAGKIREFIATLQEEYQRRHLKSKELFEKAKRYLPGGVTYSLRYFQPFPFYVKEAKGSKIWDEDNNAYTDFWMVHGAAILGHHTDFIIKKVASTLERHGGHFGWTNEWEILWAEAVTQWFQMDMVRPSNSGTEANMYATRLARAFTGRTKIGKFVGGWHGSYDGLHKGVSNLNGKDSLGLSRKLQDEIVLLKYNDTEYTIQRILQGDLAGVIVEPVMGGAGAIPGEKEFLLKLQEACRKTNTVFILDEVITGFRFYGGGKSYYGLDPDIIVAGKAIAGGYFPGAGAILGKKEIMELFDQIAHPDPNERVFHGGTYTGNLITTTGGYVLISFLKDNKTVYERLDDLGTYMREKLREAFSPIRDYVLITGLGSMIGIHILRRKPETTTPEEIIRERDKEILEAMHLWSVNNGFAYLSPHSPHLFLSTAHTKEEINEFVKVLRKFLNKLLGK